MAVGDSIATRSDPGSSPESVPAPSSSSPTLVSVLLEDLGRYLRVGAELAWRELDAAGLRSAARSVRAAISALEHQERLLLSEIGERRAFTVDGSRDVADWSANNLGVTRRTANDQIRLAEKLADLPRLAEAAARGSVSREQAAPAAELARDAGTDTGWAAQAAHLPAGVLSRHAAKRRRPSSADHRAARAARHFRAWPEGLEVRFRGSLPSDDGARLLAAIERAMPPRHVREASDPTDPSLTPDQRRADGLLALAKATLAADADPDRATIVGVLELAAVCDDDPAATAELADGQPLATETARRLLCDSRFQVVVQDRHGVTVGVGTTTRVVSPAMRRALLRRDGGCRFGGCTSTRFLEAHHIVPWPSPTTMGNLALICWHHHHAVHEGGWRLFGNPNGALHATTHTGGHTVTSHPRDHLPASVARSPDHSPGVAARPHDHSVGKNHERARAADHPPDGVDQESLLFAADTG